AIAAVKQDRDEKKAIRFTPEMYEKTYLNWMDNIHDWCISRQLWWGHRIPAWHCGACHKITVESRADFDTFYPTSLLVTGFDILFFWVARMIMLGCWFAGDAPLPDGS